MKLFVTPPEPARAPAWIPSKAAQNSTALAEQVRLRRGRNERRDHSESRLHHPHPPAPTILQQRRETQQREVAERMRIQPPIFTEEYVAALGVAAVTKLLNDEFYATVRAETP